MGRPRKLINSDDTAQNTGHRKPRKIIYDDKKIFLQGMAYHKKNNNLSEDDAKVLDEIKIRQNEFKNAMLLRKDNGVLSTKVYAKSKKAQKAREEMNKNSEK